MLWWAGVDMYFPVVSLLAFLSGSCIGWYAYYCGAKGETAGRSGTAKRGMTTYSQQSRDR